MTSNSYFHFEKTDADKRGEMSLDDRASNEIQIIEMFPINSKLSKKELLQIALTRYVIPLDRTLLDPRTRNARLFSRVSSYNNFDRNRIE